MGFEVGPEPGYNPELLADLEAIHGLDAKKMYDEIIEAGGGRMTEIVQGPSAPPSHYLTKTVSTWKPASKMRVYDAGQYAEMDFGPPDPRAIASALDFTPIRAPYASPESRPDDLRYGIVLDPDKYYVGGKDKVIANPPLIRTSLSELAESGWKLSVHASYVKSCGKSKCRFDFYDPEDRNRCLTFKFWTPEILRTREDAVAFLMTNDFKPAYNLRVGDVTAPAHINEVDYLEAQNTYRRSRIAAQTARVPISEERLSNIRSGIMFDPKGNLMPAYRHTVL